MPAFALPPRDELVDQLRRQIQALEDQGPLVRDSAVCSSGAAALDRLLPMRGFRRGTLIEWLADGQGTGAGTLALLTARQACHSAGTLVIVDRQKHFYPPALAAWGIDLERTLVVWPPCVSRSRPLGPAQGCSADEGWAVDQALRCPAVAAVWGQFERLDSKMFRRWQLAAETSGAIGLLVRPASIRGQPTWADVQLAVESREGPPAGENRRLRVEVVRCRGGAGGGCVDLELDETTGVAREVVRHETLFVHRPAELADPAPRRRSTGTF